MHISSFSGSLSPILSSSSRDSCGFIRVSTKILMSYLGLTWLQWIVCGKARYWNDGIGKCIEQIRWKYVALTKCCLEHQGSAITSTATIWSDRTFSRNY
jgi:hypothetical protein